MSRWRIPFAVLLSVGAVSGCTSTGSPVTAPMGTATSDTTSTATAPTETVTNATTHCADVSAVAGEPVAAEEDTTVGAVRSWKGYGGIASHAPPWISKFSAGERQDAAAAWCWVAISPGTVSVYLVGPTEQPRLVGSFSGEAAAPSGIPIWD